MTDTKNDGLSSVLRTAQIITVALAVGVLVFLAVVLLAIQKELKPLDTNALPSIVMALVSLGSVPLRLIVPGLIVANARRKIARGAWSARAQAAGVSLPETDEGKMAPVFLTKTIVGGAVMEGAALMNIVAFMLEGQVYSLILAGVFLVAILFGFPWRGGYEHWLQYQARRIRELRDLPDYK